MNEREAWDDLKQRAERAELVLSEAAEDAEKRGDRNESARLTAKASGVALVIDFMRAY